jgi:chemotaxis protein methyltransferase CheR
LQRGEITAPLSEATGNSKCLPAINQSPPLAKGDLGGFPPAAPKPVQDAPLISPYEEALLFYRRGEYAEAAAKLAGFLTNIPQGEASPAFGEAAVLLTQAYANQGNLTVALEWSEKAVAADRLNPRPYYLQATIFQEKGADDAAIVALKRAIYLDHGFVLAHFALANLTLRRGKPKEADRYLKNAASLLQAYGDDDILPGSEGMSARRIAEIIAATREGIEAGKGQRA